jgi:putative cell wall-binding protein
MPEKKTIERAEELKREGKSPTTQAGEFVREEMEHIREGKHGARSTKQAIAIGLSKARRAGVDLPPPKRGATTERTRKSAESAYEAGQKHDHHKPSAKRSRAITKALKREGHQAASSRALSRQAHAAAQNRTAAERSASARKGQRKRSPEERSASARKGARTRARAAHA